MERLLILYIIFCVVIFACNSVDQASFYGESHISIPLKEAKGSTDVHLKFRTKLPNGLLLLVAGMTDYCVIQLQGGVLKVKINLGAGESELSSPRNVLLNDLLWHSVYLKRKDANISLHIDDKHVIKKHLPGKFFELNVHFGIFLGGKGDFTELFLGHLESFRGCMAEIKYNGMLLLEQARKRDGQVEVRGVTWNCAAEFDANVDKEISFVEDDSFLMVSHAASRFSLRWQLELKTISEHCILIYNTGLSTKSDLFAVEIWKGKLRLLLKHSSNQIELVSDVKVNDGHWHKITLHISSTVELVVDSTPVSERIMRSGNHHLEFSDAYFIGGIEAGKRSRAMSKGLRASDISFKGCMKNIVYDNVKISLSNVKVSKGLLPGCVWQYSCLNRPCLENSQCIQKGVDSFHCKCNESLCVNPNYTAGYKIFSNSNLATNLELLSVKPLELLEGENALITMLNLHLVLDYPKYGIRDSGILFHIVEPPKYGTVSVNIWPRKENIFTLLDLSRDKVHYIHDGSESSKDHIVMDLELSAGEPFILPAYLQGRSRFSFPITIIPVNDPPILDINTALRIAQGTEEIILNKLLHAKDPDTAPQDLVYNVIQQTGESLGHFERLGQPDVHLVSFTQQDINNQQIMYVHHGGSDSNLRIALQVSDGIETSKVAFLKINTYAQHLRLQNNTGVMLVHKSSVFITPFNLSFATNTKEKLVNVKYDIVTPPQYGVIELEKLDEARVWRQVDSFTSDEMQQMRVRYRHNNGVPDHDEFKFRTSLKYITSSSTYNFRMTFIKLNLVVVHQKQIILNSTQEVLLNSTELSYQTKPLITNPISIVYHITKTPVYGYLFRPFTKYTIQTGNTFTQEDINLNNIKYRLHRKSLSYIYDTFSYIVSAPSCKNLTGNTTLYYYPDRDISTKVHAHIDRLQVVEGSKVNIAFSHLNLKVDDVTYFTFNITQPPHHGLLQVPSRNHTNYFTTTELMSGNVFYIHDDSESKHDYFKFLALSKEEENIQYAGEFHVDIILKNDNSPVRSVDKVFHVVTGGSKLITGIDLRYSDTDIDTKLSDIVYSCREITNGAIYKIDKPTEEILEFTQQDLDKELILFKHKGEEYGKIRFWVTDGQFDVNGILEVQASVPFIKIYNTKKIIVEHGKSVFITPEELSIITNLYTKDDHVIYEVINKPRNGKMSLINIDEEIRKFTQLDINAARVMYNHDGSQTAYDELKLRVRCQDTTNTISLTIRILPASYWQPLLLVNNKTLLVEESTSIVISKDILEVIQSQVSPKVVTYYVMDPPMYGYLEVDEKKKKDSATMMFSNKQFTQETINMNHLHYVQSSVNETYDRIVFNVTNGIVWLNNVILNIKVIPEHLYLGTKPLEVTEGNDAALTAANIFVETDFYKNKVTDYFIMKPPVHGCFVVHKHCNLSKSFSHKDLESGIIKYQHDNSEQLQDEITVMGIAGQKRSIPVILRVIVDSINDQKPLVVNNTGLVMWEGGYATITRDMLAAIDKDKPKDILTYTVVGCWWGNVTLKNQPYLSIKYFLQSDIDEELIQFRHTNGSEAKFVFKVSDGVHTTKENSFMVKTKPVTLTLIHTSPLHVFPLQRKYITPMDLLSRVSDADREITYVVTVSPTLGRLMLESEIPGNLKIIDIFTQNDVNSSKIFYEHTHPFADLYANDSFTLSIHSHLANSIYNQKIAVDISVSSGGLDAFVTIPKIEVIEGGLTSIRLNLSNVVAFLENHTGLRAPIIHLSVSQPRHGLIYLAEESNLTTFTQAQVESNQIKYQHDHSDSLNDSVQFSLYLIPGYITLCNVTVPIKVNPINDQPFKLVTVAPKITVVQGENYTITSKDLLTEDADTIPEDLKYDIITSPTEGKLVLVSDKNSEGTVVSKFSQSDIDANRIVYVHSGSLSQASFYFRVWDGKFKPEYTLFNIQITPVLINVSVGIPVYLQQGTNVASLSSDQFIIETNADRSKCHFTVSQKPSHGVVYVRDVPASKFTMGDLEGKSVMYMQTDMTTANDSFKVFVGISNNSSNIGSVVDIIVKVQPLMQIGNLTAISGTKNRLGLSVLDATALAKLTSSNPKYTVVQKPHHGQIRKIIRSSGEKRYMVDSHVRMFTHEEVKSGLIYFVAQTVDVIDQRGVEDKIIFSLAASIFQPAIGEIRFRIWPNLVMKMAPTLAGPSDPASHEGGMQITSPNLTSDYFLIVTVVAGIVVVGIAVVVIIKCRSLENNRNDIDKEGHCMQPIPLPRPPDQLMPNSPHLKRYMSDSLSIPTNNSTPLPAAVSVPQCKVTPLRPVDSVANSELDVHARYPYGTSDDQTEDWSSYDTSDPSYPTRTTNLMLRKNQYWV